MYLNDADAVPFYQAEDGQLVFLIGFNMVCLCADFSKTRPVEGMQDQPPLPDYLSGRILEIQNVHLTPDIRKRMPFLEHIPLYTDISFVELDLSSILSNETKKKFRADLEKRKKKRQSKVKAEKKADREARVEEARLITDRKARLTLIDPSDEFFQPTLSAEQETFITQDVEETHFEMGNHDSSVQVPCEIIASQPFLAACKRSVNPLRLESKEFFPGLQGGVDAFPALGVSSTKMPSKQKHALIPETPIALATKDVGKKKGEKGKKVVLFSTSGQRGYNF